RLLHQTVVDQHRQAIEEAEGMHAVRRSAVSDDTLELVYFATDQLGSLKCAAAGKHAQPAKQRLRLSLQQVIAPRHSRAQRLMATAHVDGAAVQQVQTLIEALQQRLWGEDGETRGGKFERQRQSVQASTNLGHRPQI